jgi:hypothetical protein
MFYLFYLIKVYTIHFYSFGTGEVVGCSDRHDKRLVSPGIARLNIGTG